MTFYDQLPALIGVVLGSGMTFSATYWVDRTRWRREQTIRWDERKFSIYLDYSNAVKDLVTIAARLATNEPLESGIGPLERTAENFDKLDAAEARRTLASEALRLLVDPDTGTAAREMTRCAWDLCRLVRKEPGRDDSQWKRAFADYEIVRDDYLMCARKALKITGPHFARTPRLRSRSWTSPLGDRSESTGRPEIAADHTD